jgi:hypothetical protein
MSSILERLRDIIQETSVEHPEIGPIEKSTKWGDESYAPARKRIGSSVRLQPRAGGEVALMFICTTGLVAKFRETYPGLFTTEGERAVVFSPGRPIPDAETRHIVAMALTNKLKQN